MLRKSILLICSILLIVCISGCARKMDTQNTDSSETSVNSENVAQDSVNNLRIKTSEDLEKVLSKKDLEEVFTQYGISRIDAGDRFDYEGKLKEVDIRYYLYDNNNEEIGYIDLGARLYGIAGIEIYSPVGDFHFKIQNSNQAQELLDSYLSSEYYQGILPNEELGRTAGRFESYAPFIDSRIENGAFIYDMHDSLEHSEFNGKLFLKGNQCLNLNFFYQVKGNYSLEERKISPIILDKVLSKIANNIHN